MQIPDHLVDLVRELAEVHLAETLGHVRLIEAYRSPDHKDALQGRARLERARELCAHLRASTRAAA